MIHFVKFFMPVILLLQIPVNVHSQDFIEIETQVYTEPYVPLENAEVLADYLPDWNGLTIAIELDEPIFYNILDGFQIHTLELESFGLVYHYGSNPEENTSFGMVTVPFDGLFTDPLLNTLNQDSLSILYQFDGEFSVIEFRNVASLWDILYTTGTHLDSRFNFQIEIRHSDGRIRYKYGPSFTGFYMDGFLNLAPQSSGLAIEFENDTLEYFGIMLLTGSPHNPAFEFFDDMDELNPDELEFFSAFPDSGTIYEFLIRTPQPTNISDIATTNLKVYPNPTFSHLHIKSEHSKSPDTRVKILNSHGLLLKAVNYCPDKAINVQSLPAGTYFLKISNKKTSHTIKWVKM